MNTPYTIGVALITLLIMSLMCGYILKRTKKYGYDFLVNFIGLTLAVMPIALFFYVLVAELSIWMISILVIYELITGTIATVWFRHKIMEWKTSSGWRIYGSSTIDILFKQIGQRLQVEFFSWFLGLLLGPLGMFLLGLKEVHVEEIEEE